MVKIITTKSEKRVPVTFEIHEDGLREVAIASKQEDRGSVSAQLRHIVKDWQKRRTEAAKK